jgi:hypothetical protein
MERSRPNTSDSRQKGRDRLRGCIYQPRDANSGVNQIEAVGVLAIGAGLVIGSIATTQGFSRMSLPAVFVVGIGVAVAGFGRYR